MSGYPYYSGGYTQYPPQQQAPAPPPQQPPQQQQQTTTTVVVNNQDNSGPRCVALRDMPITTKCSACGSSILTMVKYEIGCMTLIVSGILCFFGLWLCCLIPCCLSSCKDVVHRCPNCRAVIGRYRRM